MGFALQGWCSTEASPQLWSECAVGEASLPQSPCWQRSLPGTAGTPPLRCVCHHIHISMTQHTMVSQKVWCRFITERLMNQHVIISLMLWKNGYFSLSNVDMAQ